METLLWQVTPTFGAGIEEDEQLVVISKDQALRLRPQVKALSCRTWGEVKALGPAVYQEMLGMAGYGEYEDYIRHFDIQGLIPLAPDDRTVAEHAVRSATGLPDDDEPFDGESLPAFEDGDWPPMVAALVAGSVPGDILSEYGYIWDTVFNGEMAAIPASQQDSVRQALLQQGFILEQVDWLHEFFIREEYA